MHDGFINGDDYDFTSVCGLCSQDRLFADECKVFTPHRSGDSAEHSLMLPTSFIIPNIVGTMAGLVDCQGVVRCTGYCSSVASGVKLQVDYRYPL
jgi:hypothetical protein